MLGARNADYKGLLLSKWEKAGSRIAIYSWPNRMHCAVISCSCICRLHVSFLQLDLDRFVRFLERSAFSAAAIRSGARRGRYRTATTTFRTFRVEAAVVVDSSPATASIQMNVAGTDIDAAQGRHECLGTLRLKAGVEDSVAATLPGY